MRRLGFSGTEIMEMPEGMAAGYLAASMPDGIGGDGGGGNGPKTYKVRRRRSNGGKS